jgi:hypothetical protein
MKSGSKFECSCGYSDPQLMWMKSFDLDKNQKPVSFGYEVYFMTPDGGKMIQFCPECKTET